jgi:hydrogenase expression/formation protein HypE
MQKPTAETQRAQRKIPTLRLCGEKQHICRDPYNMTRITPADIALMSIKGVLFDFDGTLTEPGSLDFAVIRDSVKCPQGQPILEFIESLPSEEAKRARQILDRHEIEAAGRSQPNRGAEEIIRFLQSCRMKIGIISRNSTRAILRALENFQEIGASDFEVIISRDESLSPKPSPAMVLAAGERMGLQASQMLVIGDFVFDIEAGYRAGCQTVFLTNRDPSSTCSVAPDYTISDLSELREVIALHLPLPSGKLPNILLNRILKELKIGDPSLLIAPGVGEDIAAVTLEGEEVLVLKSDPITFATDAIGYYAVLVNANDIATCGASPRWLLSSLLFPRGSTAAGIRRVISELHEVSRKHGIVLCGGHTEITDAVTRPVVACQVAGTVTRRGLIDKRAMREGDQILMTRGIALEGTSIIARELPDRLLESGMSPHEIDRCRQLLMNPGIAILAEARIAASSAGTTAMHDVTEGGLATALEELSAAGLHRLRVYPERIRILEETKRVCAVLGLDPLGLIASGSLLITCGPGHGADLARSIQAAGIDVAVIGEVLEEGEGIEVRDGRGRAANWPHFRTDELARLFENQKNLR